MRKAQQDRAGENDLLAQECSTSRGKDKDLQSMRNPNPKPSVGTCTYLANPQPSVVTCTHIHAYPQGTHTHTHLAVGVEGVLDVQVCGVGTPGALIGHLVQHTAECQQLEPGGSHQRKRDQPGQEGALGAPGALQHNEVHIHDA